MIRIEDLSKSYGTQRVLAGITADFEGGRTHVLLGSSGCGKSTLLRSILGLIPADGGSVTIEGRPVQAIPRAERSRMFGYVVQNAGLFPHLTGRENVEFPLRVHGLLNGKSAARIEELSALVQLRPGVLDSYPSQLSGGQQQRVGLMRALALDPAFLLMDEPLSALDPLIRSDLQSELRKIFRMLKKTVLLVTHDIREAYYLGDRVILMNGGAIEQDGTVSDFRRSPRTDFVKKFLNSQLTVEEGEAA